MKQATGESPLSRAVRVIAAFTPGDPALRVSDVAERTGLHTATASRLVAQLVSEGVLTRDGDRRVRIGVRLWELAMRASPTMSLRDAAMPSMEKVHAAVGHNVQLGVLGGEEVLFVERLSSPNAVVSCTHVAGRLPLCASSCGLVLLAFGGRDLQARVLSHPIARFTRHTMTTAAEVAVALEQVRRDGYSHLSKHIHEGSAGMAVPIRGPRGAVVASLGVVVPADWDVRAVTPLLLAAARSVERSIREWRDPVTEAVEQLEALPAAVGTRAGRSGAVAPGPFLTQ